jgi:hypothetical protein
VYFAARQVTLRYPLLLANVSIPHLRLETNSPVTSVQFTDPHFYLRTQPNACIDNITDRRMMNVVWRGFAPIWHYQRHAKRLRLHG